MCTDIKIAEKVLNCFILIIIQIFCVAIILSRGLFTVTTGVMKRIIFSCISFLHECLPIYVFVVCCTCLI